MSVMVKVPINVPITVNSLKNKLKRKKAHLVLRKCTFTNSRLWCRTKITLYYMSQEFLSILLYDLSALTELLQILVPLLSEHLFGIMQIWFNF